MTKIISGIQFKRFFSDPEFWPQDNGATYYDDVVYEVNGVELDDDQDVSTIADDAKLVITCGGTVFGAGRDKSLDAYFKQWEKRQTNRSFVVECHVDQLDALKAAIRAAGGRVI